MLSWLLRLLDPLIQRLPVAYADSASLHAVGVDLTPLEGQLPDIVMRREAVDIYLYPSLAVVEAVFELHNDGPVVDLDVGFPCFRSQSRYKSHDTGLLNFAVFVDGQPVTHGQKQLDNIFYPMWYAWRQHFPTGRTSMLTVRYWVPLISYNMVSRIPFIYVLRTGRFWKGHIGEAIIRVHAEAIPLAAIQEATPPGYKLDEQHQLLTWEFADLDPEDDIGLLISPTIIQAALVGLDADDILDINERRPSEGTRVIVGGRLRIVTDDWAPDKLDAFIHDQPIPGSPALETLTVRLFGERDHDGNILIPDRIKVFNSSERDTSIRVRLHATTRYGQLDVPYVDFSFRKEVIKGTIQYEHGELIIDADEWFLLVNEPVYAYDYSQLRQRFPWVNLAERKGVWQEAAASADHSRDSNGMPDPTKKTQWPGGSTRYTNAHSVGEGFYGIASSERAKVEHGHAGSADNA